MKVQDLSGPRLDYWVARAMGRDAVLSKYCDRPELPSSATCFRRNGAIFSPSKTWAQGGPIIARNLISISYDDQGGREKGMWNAYVHDCDLMCQDFDSALVAGMRAFVASVFGDSVPEDSGVPGMPK